MVFQDLSENVQQQVVETFKIFDVDGSKNIDKTEAIKHWKSNYGKISAKEFFDQVDFDGNGEISEEEFVRFWRIVKGAGHTDDEILVELENIRNGELWVGFENVHLAKKGTKGTKD